MLLEIDNNQANWYVWQTIFILFLKNN